MKKLVLLSIVAIMGFTACQKEQSTIKPNGSKTDNNLVDQPMGYSTGTAYDTIFNRALMLHNNFLDSVYNGVKNGTINLNDINTLRNRDSTYFLENGYSSGQIGYLNSQLYPKVADSGLAFTFSNSLIDSDPFTHHIDSVINGIITITNLSNLTLDSVETLLHEQYEDIVYSPNYNTQDKEAAAAVFGIASGSCEYWSENFDKWQTIMPSQQVILASSQATVRVKKICGFIDADCTGGEAGAILGSAAPLVGNVAGAVAGAAIFSAAAALFW